MRYVKTVDLFVGDNHARLIDGTLTLQRGQWINCCGTDHPPSRYYGVSPAGVIYAAHYPRHVAQFSSWCARPTL